MAKVKKKLTPAQKRAKKKAKEERQKKYVWVFMNGKQVRVKRPETIDGVDPDEFIRNNADPIWLHQNEMLEYMDQEEDQLYVGEESELDSYIYNYCGKWRDSEGNTIFIEPIDEKQVYVTYVKSGEGKPMLRPWLNNMPASKMIGRHDPEWGPSLDIELSNKGDGFCLSLDFHFEDGNYNAIAPSIIRDEKDSHLDKYYYLFGALSSYHRQSDNGANKAN
ncbi:MAG: hypothetical protein LJE91_12625 [Gammaproteobacteria bacterium]|jgi:hypothetical protein|nr:hypothetical protein [Gammaproteobacteria bacterium]